MALEVGSRLGQYDVTALIGEGGMVKTGDEENLEITVVLNWFEELTRLAAVD